MKKADVPVREVRVLHLERSDPMRDSNKQINEIGKSIKNINNKVNKVDKSEREI